jgi:hypothetical protein
MLKVSLNITPISARYVISRPLVSAGRGLLALLKNVGERVRILLDPIRDFRNFGEKLLNQPGQSLRLGEHVVLVEQIDGEAANLVGQVAARFVVDAARLRTQLNGLRDLVPIARDRIELVHVGLDGGFAGASMVSGRLDELVDVLALLLQDAWVSTS